VIFFNFCEYVLIFYVILFIMWNSSDLESDVELTTIGPVLSQDKPKSRKRKHESKHKKSKHKKHHKK